MILVPVDIPVTVPVDPIVAIPGEEEDHDPPVNEIDKVVVSPSHTVKVPVIGALEDVTVTIVVTVHPPVVV
jgi:hypothetical protein